MKLLQRSEFEGVPQPELIAECIVRVLKDRDQKARSGLRGAMNYYRVTGSRPAFAAFLKKIINS
ncbi:MAG: hypothetical protein ACRCV5_06560, partial [Afipia sp.]